MSEPIDFDPTSPALGPGERLGVWRLQHALGAVPSGHWWRVQHSVGTQAALALLYDDPQDAGAVLLRMAQSEGQPWLHPDVAWPIDSGLAAGGRPYVIMPALEGEPLVLAARQASLRRRLEWVLQLCELLLLAQAKGLAPVELDPSLLWLGPQQQLRLHALALVHSSADAMRLGSLQGQVSRAALPLQCPASQLGSPGGAQAQVFAVGVLMCWLVNGRYPNDPAPPQTPVQALSQWVSLPGGAREALDALLRAAVHPDPQQRPLDLEVLGQTIEHWLQANGESVSTGAATLTPAAPPSVAPPPLEPAPLLRTLPPPHTAAPSPVITAPPGSNDPPPGAPPRWALALVALTVVLIALALVAGYRGLV